MIVQELERIASHLVAVGTYGLDLGAFTPVLWAFRDREVILDLFEALSGHRFTHNYMRVGGVLYDLPRAGYSSARSGRRASSIRTCPNWRAC